MEAADVVQWGLTALLFGALGAALLKSSWGWLAVAWFATVVLLDLNTHFGMADPENGHGFASLLFWGV